MKIESELHKGVFYEKWKTPVMHSNDLWLELSIQTFLKTYFFFKIDQLSEIHILSFRNGWPYRVTEEGLGYGCINRYFNNLKPGRKNTKHCSTWKLWNTSFILDMEAGGELSGLGNERNSHICEFLICTENEWIEFITFAPPKWEIRKNISIIKLANEIIKKDYSSEKVK